MNHDKQLNTSSHNVYSNMYYHFIGNRVFYSLYNIILSTPLNLNKLIVFTFYILA